MKYSSYWSHEGILYHLYYRCNMPCVKWWCGKWDSSVINADLLKKVAKRISEKEVKQFIIKEALRNE